MPIRSRRWNDPVEEGDGYRLLICRYRPRGVRREDETWDAWCPELGPSPDLHAAAYGKVPAGDAAPSGRAAILPFAEYEVRYREEMTRRRWYIEGFAKRVREGETLTLLCSSACVDPARCHRTVLAKLIEEVAFPTPPARGTVIVRGRT